MPLRLTRLQISDQIIAGSSTPTQQFLRYFNKALEKIEDAVNGLSQAVTDIATAQADADAANTALANGAILVKDEGGTGAETHTVNFVGAGVTSSVASGVATVTIPSASGALTLISEQTPTGTGTVTFPSIPNTYRHLRLIVTGRGTAAATTVAMTLRMNNDSGAKYDRQRLRGTAAAASAAEAFGATSIDGNFVADTATADIAGAVDITVYDYKGTTYQKLVIWSETYKTGTASGNMEVSLRSGFFRDTSAITQLDAILSSGNYKAGTVASLYGIS